MLWPITILKERHQYKLREVVADEGFIPLHLPMSQNRR